MPRPSNPSLFDDFCLAYAVGQRISAWCKARKVAVSTAYEWRKSPEFAPKVESYRSEVRERVINLAAAWGVGSGPPVAADLPGRAA
jgi:hypothetical protein